MRFSKLIGLVLLFSGCCAFAQTVSPVIVEYKARAQGRFALTNNTLTPMAVVLEPKSFSIAPDGNGQYRPLDAGIHLQLSAMSFRIDPGQTYYVFYKATADKLPAWFTVYSVFSSLQYTGGLDVRILLPHTVYINPKKPLGPEAVRLDKGEYNDKTNKVELELENPGPDLERVQEVLITGGDKTATAAGFPLLPGAHRTVEVTWSEAQPPLAVSVRLERTTLNEPLAMVVP
ncbi:MAG: hypothetical protein WBE72_09635 [Terracidiphilus sp.]